MKFEKTVAFDLYEIGDRVMQDVIFFVDLAITDDNKIICTGAVPDIDCLPYLSSLGGSSVVDYWQEQVDNYFKNEDNCADVLGEAMTDDEYNEFEDVLLGNPGEEPRPVLKAGKVNKAPW